MTNTLWKDFQYVPFNDFIIDITHVTTNVQQLMLSILAYSGMFGNTVFFICSAWFLLDRKKTNMKKCLYIFADTWVISILILGITVAIRGSIDLKHIIKELFPNTFGNNWYVTCYLLFLFLYPALNSVIYAMSQTKLLQASAFLAVIYIFIGFVKQSFFTSPIIIWIAIYFLIAYVKLYVPSICDHRKLNVCILAGGIAANIALVVVTNTLGLHINLLSDKLLYWNSNCSPILIVTGFAAFNLFRNFRFGSRIISGISRLTLLIYLFHENLLFRELFRPYLWHFVYTVFGYRYVVLWLFVLSAVLFIAAVIISFAYSKTVQRILKRACDRMYPYISIVCLKIESKLIAVR